MLAALDPKGLPLVARHLPEPLLREGPAGLLWWQWIAAPLVLLAAAGAGWLLGRITLRLLARLARRTATHWDDLLVERLGGPVGAFWTVVAAAALRPALALPEEAAAGVGLVLRASLSVAVFWAALRSVDVASRALALSPWGRAHAAGAAALPSLRRVAKVALFSIGAIAVLGQFGYPVGSLLAGLGIGGLAVALAAQKTVENLIGSVAIGIDVPFRAGDYVRVEGIEGSVETIGLRSTRLRTLDRTLVTIPNGKLADARIETFGSRDRIRLHVTLQLVYGTTANQMREVIAGVERALRDHPLLWQEELQVRFVGLSAWSLDVEVMAWFRASYQEFLAARQELLLRFLEVVEVAETSLAFPTRTVHLAGQGRARP